MWKQLKKAIILFLCLTPISPLPLNVPAESSVGSSLNGISSVNSTLNGLSQYVLTDNDVDRYLEMYGYLQRKDRVERSLPEENYDERAESLKHFQGMFGLPQTGLADEETLQLMNTPRCGNSDVIVTRNKRFVHNGHKWYKNLLTWDIVDYTDDLPRHMVDWQAERAFQLWASAGKIKFERVTGKQADIEIKFESKGFEGNVLASAFFPVGSGRFTTDGNIRVNDNVRWVAQNFPGGAQLLYVLTHEIGHSIGISHSEVPEAIMAPTYPGFKENLQLHQDDIDAVQHVYGELPPLQKPCEVHGRENRLDAVVMMNSGTVYGFRENTYFPITEAGKPEPLPITDWEGLIGKIDAAVSISPKYNRTMRDGEITRELIEGESLLVFQGSRVFKFNVEDKSLAPGYPQEIRDVFPGLPTNIDSAFTWSGNGKLYVTKGDVYYRLTNGEVDEDFPKQLRKWRKLPGYLDAAFQWHGGNTYFIKDSKIYSFDDDRFKVLNYYKFKDRLYNCYGRYDGVPL